MWSSISCAFWFWSSEICEPSLILSVRRSEHCWRTRSISERRSYSSCRSMEERADEGASCLGVGGGEDGAVAGLPRGRPVRPRPGAALGTAAGGKSSTTMPWRLEGDARPDPGAFRPAPGAFSPPGGRTPAGLAAGLDVGLGAMAGGSSSSGGLAGFGFGAAFFTAGLLLPAAGFFAAGGAALGGGAAFGFHFALTSAASEASLTLFLWMSERPSRWASMFLSPMIFQSTPKISAPVSLRPGALSASNFFAGSAISLVCSGVGASLVIFKARTRNLAEFSLTCGFLFFKASNTSASMSPKPTTMNTASHAAPMASVTVGFFSLNLSSIAGRMELRYLPKGFLRPLARASMTLAATVTTMMFASFMLFAQPRTMSSKEPSWIKGTLTTANVSSSASFLSFHFELPNRSLKSAGILESTSTGSNSGSRSMAASSSSTSSSSTTSSASSAASLAAC